MRPQPVTWFSTLLTIMALGLVSAQSRSADLEAAHLTKSMAAKAPSWRADELDRISQADDFHVAPYRDNHVTLGTPTKAWSVAVDGDLYVRASNGTRASWYKSAVRERAGQISAAGMKKLVAFEPVQGAINDKIDAAYRARYSGSKYLDAMLSERASAATVRIKPAE
jgi:hypothetical protein